MLTRKYSRISSTDGPLGLHEKLVFMHIPKTGGTSAHFCLSKCFDESDVCPERSNNIHLWHPRALERYRYFCAHASTKDLAHIVGPTKIVTFLRNPIERLVSHYRYLSSFSNETIERENIHQARLCKSLSFEECINEEGIQFFYNLWNPSTQALVGDTIFDTNGEPWRSDDQIMDTAISIINNFAYAGVSEAFDECFNGMCETLDIPNHNDGTKLNVTDNNCVYDNSFTNSADVSLTTDIISRCNEILAIDIAIYRHVFQTCMGSRPLEYNLTLSAIEGKTIEKRYRYTYINNNSKIGIVVYGPYINLFEGLYKCHFIIKIDMSEFSYGTRVARFEITKESGGEVLSFVDYFVNGNSYNGDIDISLEFNIDTYAAGVEFRVYSFVEAGLSVSTSLLLQRRIAG